MSKKMKSDGVSVAFSIIMDEITTVVDQLNQEGVKAFKSSKYSVAEKLSESGKKLDSFREKLEKLKIEWDSGIDIATRKRVKVDSSYSLKPHKKSPKTVLKVTLINGRTIQSSTAAQTMAETVKELGIEKVMQLGYKVNGIYFVSKNKDNKYPQVLIADYYVCTHSNTVNKRKLLLKMSNELGVPIKVEIVQPSRSY